MTGMPASMAARAFSNSNCVVKSPSSVGVELFTPKRVCRTLKYVCGHEMRMAVNYTDVDDKTINGNPSVVPGLNFTLQLQSVQQSIGSPRRGVLPPLRIRR